MARKISEVTAAAAATALQQIPVNDASVDKRVTVEQIRAYAQANTKLDDLAAPDNNTDLNATTGRHGLLPALGGGTTNFLRADGTWAAPPGGSGGTHGIVAQWGNGIDAIVAANENVVMVRLPSAGTVSKVSLLSTDAAGAAVTGSAVIDAWKVAYSAFPPAVANTITASAKPTLASASKYEDATLTGWTTTITAGDVIAFKIDSSTTCKQLTLVLEYA